ncbi:MAG: hypothetical protein ACRDF6_03135 [bacterium]
MVRTSVSGEQLYPSARELFRAGQTSPDPRPRRIALVWLLAGMLAAVVARRLLFWIDHNV